MTQTKTRLPLDVRRGARPVAAATAAVATPPPSIPSSPARHRRRPALIGAGVALIALGGLTAGWLVTSTGDTVRVLALTRPVAAGQVVDRGDLVVADVHLDPSLQSVPASRISSVVGRHATTGLLAGALLTPASTTDQVVPGAGESLVGVSLTAAQMPAEALVPGDAVRIVDTPTAQAAPPALVPASIRGRVAAFPTPDQNGSATVDLLVPEAQAAGLAARAATGRVALVVDSREH